MRHTSIDVILFDNGWHIFARYGRHGQPILGGCADGVSCSGTVDRTVSKEYYGDPLSKVWQIRMRYASVETMPLPDLIDLSFRVSVSPQLTSNVGSETDSHRWANIRRVDMYR